jgi:putative nucleotidyltransferase with HDIG domain
MASHEHGILIVEDDQSFARIAGDVLTDAGYEITHASDAEAALEQLSRGVFSAAVVDLVLPGMGGMELAKRIRNVDPDTQVLILTGHGDLDSAIEGIRQGAFDYIQKGSLDIPRLERSLRQATEKSRLARANRELTRQLQEQNQLLQALQQVTTSLAGEPDISRLLDRVVTAAKELCGAEAGRVILIEEAPENSFVIVSSSGDDSDSALGARLGVGEGIPSLALESGDAILVDDPRSHPRYSQRSDEFPTHLPGLICAPMSHRKIRGALTVAGRHNGVFGAEHRELLKTLARHASVGIDNAQLQDKGTNFFAHVSELLISALESREQGYPGHSRRVATLADLVSKRMGLTDTERRSVHFGALLHDIGKLRLSTEILRRQPDLSDEERSILETHAALGVEILKPVTAWEEVLPVVLAHHERWDGRGYPRGLAGTDIPLGARIVAVADAFDVMTKRGTAGVIRTSEQALTEIEAGAGTQFDARVARLFAVQYRGHREELS